MKLFAQAYHNHDDHRWYNAFEEAKRRCDDLEICGLENWEIEERVLSVRQDHVADNVAGNNWDAWRLEWKQYFEQVVHGINTVGQFGFEDVALNSDNVDRPRSYLAKLPNPCFFIHVVSVEKVVNSKSENQELLRAHLHKHKACREGEYSPIGKKSDMLRLPGSPDMPDEGYISEKSVDALFQCLSPEGQQEFLSQCLPYEGRKPLWFALLRGIVDIFDLPDWPDRIRDALGLAHYGKYAWLTVFKIESIALNRSVRPTILEAGPYLHPCYYPGPTDKPFGVSMDLIENDENAVLPFELIHSPFRLEKDDWMRSIGRVSQHPRQDLDCVRANHKRRLVELFG